MEGKMKKIVAWVNKWDRKQLEKYSNANIYFAYSLEDFNNHLKTGVFPLFSLGLAGKTSKKCISIIKSHPELIFYFLDKRTKNWNLMTADWKVRNLENVEGSLLDHQEVIPFASDPPVIPKRILETGLLIHEEVSLE
jgi:hypothetical protein